MGWFSKKKGEMKVEGGAPAVATPSRGEKAKDPVCGMDVDPKKAAATSVHQGQTYYFCAVGCKKAFDQDPAKYLGGKAKGGMPAH